MTYRVMLAGVVLHTTNDRIDAVQFQRKIETGRAASGLDCWPQIVESDDDQDPLPRVGDWVEVLLSGEWCPRKVVARIAAGSEAGQLRDAFEVESVPGRYGARDSWRRIDAKRQQRYGTDLLHVAKGE